MNKSFTLSERSLIENCINGNRKSQKELYQRFSPGMFDFCLHYTNNQTDAEDILQNAFVKLFNNLHHFKGDQPFEEWVRKIFVKTAAQQSKVNKVKITIDEAFKNITNEHIIALDDLYENIYTKTDKTVKNTNSPFKLYAVDSLPVNKTTGKAETIENKATTQHPAEKKPLIRVVKNTVAENQRATLTYTLQKGDEKRINKDGVLRVYNMSTAIDIPVKKLLGKWNKSHVGVTLAFINERWHVDGEMVKHIFQDQEVSTAIGFKRLLKFV